MYRYVFAGALLLLIGAHAGHAALEDPMQVPTTDEAFDKLVAKLKTEAEAFVKARNDKGPAASPLVKRVQYSQESAKHLTKALATRSGGPMVELYVAYQLLQPLKMAGNDTIRPVAPALVRLLRQHCKYKPMPHWPRATLAALNPPGDMPGDQLMKEMQRVQQLRAKKTQAERPIVKQNRTVRQLERTIKSLLAMVGGSAADEALLNRLVEEERSTLLTYEDTLAAIKAEAGQMDRARAKRIYDGLKNAAFRVGTKKNYVDPSQPRYSITGNSSFHSAPTYFAVSTLTVVNLVATAAKEPAVPIPNVKKYEEQKKQQRPARRGGR